MMRHRIGKRTEYKAERVQVRLALAHWRIVPKVAHKTADEPRLYEAHAFRPRHIKKKGVGKAYGLFKLACRVPAPIIREDVRMNDVSAGPQRRITQRLRLRRA